MKKKKLPAARRREQQYRLARQRLDRIHENLLRLPNTYATYVGQRCRNGKWQREVAIVSLVSQKKAPSQLLPARSVPKKLRWVRAGRAKMYSTDVLRVAPRFVPQAGVLGPGDDVIAGTTHATVGVALNHPTLGRCVTTAAHLFESAGSAVEVKVSRGGARQPVRATVRPITSLVDYALLRASAGTQCANFFEDARRIGPAFLPTDVDIGAPVFVLLSTGKMQRTVCRGIHAAINTPEETLRDCILTDLATLGGDSGACLVDGRFRVWGLLRGQLGRTFSVFAPIHHLLRKEGASLL